MIFPFTPDKPRFIRGFSRLILWRNLWRMWKTPVTEFLICQVFHSYVNIEFRYPHPTRRGNATKLTVIANQRARWCGNPHSFDRCAENETDL